LKDAAAAFPGVVEVYEWVRNTIAPEFYYGVMKGDVQTWLERSGNDADTAAVLVQMLRARGVPARYVRGVVQLPAAALVEAVGTATVEQAVRALERAGIPHEVLLGSGGVAAVKLEHVWSEAYVPYANYRGALLDAQGKAWVPLDAAYKALTRPTGLAPAELGFDAHAAWDEYLGADETVTPLEFVRNRVSALLTARPGIAYEDLLNRRAVVAEVYGLLPNRLPYDVVSVIEVGYDLPETLVHTLRLRGERSGRTLLDASLPVPDVLGRRLTLSYEPATEDDADVVAGYGALALTPPYLVEVKPVIRSGGASIAAGDPIGLAVAFTLRMDLATPGGTRVVTNSVVAGNTTAIGLGGLEITAPEEGRGSAAEILSGVARAYQQAWNEADAELSDLMKVVPLRPTVSVCLVSSAVEVEYAGGDSLYPLSYEWKGLLIDADVRSSAPVGVDSREAEGPFLLLSGLQGSILENRVFETRHEIPSVSTAKTLGLAASQGMQVLELTAANERDLLPALPFDPVVKEEVRDAVARGFTVRIPAQNVTYRAWTGVGYVIVDEETSEAAYQLQGRHSGGVTAASIIEWPADLRDTLMVKDGQPTESENRGVARLQKYQTTDFQIGTVNKPLPRPLRVLATDGAGYALPNVWVTFTVIGGGGVLVDPAGKGQGAELSVRTDEDGVAAVTMVLGKRTDEIPRFLLPGRSDEYATQSGLNLVTARAELARLDEPFSALSLPDNRIDSTGTSYADLVLRTGLDAGWSANLRVAGLLSIGVQDPYGNPLSNFAIRVAYHPPARASSRSGYIPLRGPNDSPAGALAPKDYERCAAVAPIVLKDECPGEAPAVVVRSSAFGAFVYPVLGGSPFSHYYYDVGTVLSPDVLWIAYATTGPACYGSAAECALAALQPDGWVTAGARSVLVNTLGNLVEAYPPGGTATAGFWTDVIYEQERIVNRRDEEKNEDHFVAEGTNQWRREHLDNSRLSLTPLTSGTTAGSVGSRGGGQYEGAMTMALTPMLNTVQWDAVVRPQMIPYLPAAEAKWPGEVDPSRIDNSDRENPKLIERVYTDRTWSFTGKFSLWGARAQILGVAPAPLFLRENETTAHPASVGFTIEPAAFAQELLPIQVLFELKKDGQSVLSANGTNREADGSFRIPADLPLAPSMYTANLSLLGVAGRTGGTMTADAVPVEAGIVTLTVDTNNDTVVDDKDDEEFRKDPTKPFAFWIAEPDASGLRALEDYATIRVRVPFTLQPGETLALSMPFSRWLVRKKVGPGKAYLSDVTAAATQLASLSDSLGQPIGPFNDMWMLPSYLLQSGDNEFLFRCERHPDGSPGCAVSTIRLERVLGASNRPLLGERKVEIRPVSGWMSAYSMRSGASQPPTPSVNSPTPRAVVVPSWLNWEKLANKPSRLTVIVHGFNVSEEDALQTFFPTFFKRLYWVGHQVLLRQGGAASGYAHTIGVSWPGNQGGEVLGGVYFPEDEFHALQSGVPLSGLLRDVLRPSSRSISIVAHSLGNMVVNSALMQRGMKNVVDRYIMYDAAIAADSFDASYEYSLSEQVNLFVNAEEYGFGYDGSARPIDDRWQRDWQDMQAGRPYALVGPADQRSEMPDFTDIENWRDKVSKRMDPALLPKPMFELRWRQQRIAGEIPAMGGDVPERGPWRGLFAGNLERTRFLNAYNRDDQVLRIDGVVSPSFDLHAWYTCQIIQKPNVGPLGLAEEGRSVQFWALLEDTDASQEYLWGFQGIHANITRQWAEVAHWFPAVSGPAGSRPVAGMQNEDMRAFAGNSGFGSHTYMTSKALPIVWNGYAAYRKFLRP
jgi:hypothetical protein